MKETDFPALYRCADDASNTAQRYLINLYKGSTAVLILAASLAPFADRSSILALINAALFGLSLFLFVIGQQKKFQEKWYKARALAESIKTSVWRLTMNAQPFSDGTEDEKLVNFQKLLTELLTENASIGDYLAGDNAGDEQITDRMIEVMRSSFQHKKDLYLASRIKDQREWYARKSGINRKVSSGWTRGLYLAYAIAILILLTKVYNPLFALPPVDLFAVVASCIIGWMQIKRYDELASAYGLTAHEIGIIEGRFRAVHSEEHLARFVADAENAFSREHTQWAARRDH